MFNRLVTIFRRSSLCIMHYALCMAFFIMHSSLCIGATTPDSTIYQGMSLKLDIGNTIISLAVSKAGQGGFARLGLDINGLKKHPENPNALLVGLRIGTALQGYDLTNVSHNAPYWGDTRADYHNLFHADCWGEVVAGCQVQVYKGFQMGWYLRFKVLFTRTAKDININDQTTTQQQLNNALLPYYIPGFGYRNDTNWGFNYYIAYSF